MLFGVREICNVVFRAKAPMMVGDKKFYKDEPVIYFDTLKTSTLEGASTTVYAQGGRGNARLVAWDGDRTVTFTMEDALISAEGLQILMGTGIVKSAQTGKELYQHATQRVAITNGTLGNAVDYSKIVAGATKARMQSFLFFLDENGEIFTEPYLVNIDTSSGAITKATDNPATTTASDYEATDWEDDIKHASAALLDYYVERDKGMIQFSITPDSFGGNFYIEADTLFRNQAGQDLPAEFVIPNGKIQSNFTFSMAAEGDPSTFTFTVDAFPDYPKYDMTQKVYADIQVITKGTGDDEEFRTHTVHQD